MPPQNPRSKCGNQMKTKPNLEHSSRRLNACSLCRKRTHNLPLNGIAPKPNPTGEGK
uniref:Uncharacterized protein n=1 Tax=Setaria italica TaxID=4555 RepID=K3YKR0_SETIT